MGLCLPLMAADKEEFEKTKSKAERVIGSRNTTLG